MEIYSIAGTTPKPITKHIQTRDNSRKIHGGENFEKEKLLNIKSPTVSRETAKISGRDMAKRKRSSKKDMSLLLIIIVLVLLFISVALISSVYSPLLMSLIGTGSVSDGGADAGKVSINFVYLKS